eukprot:TRINITY_DN1995_c0_g1_i4.p1 TRINITY_DN1995_c0_g1~~TRINITY_DN1995_c0_g1_i4.p1  ORF type:complete len:803 (+),score=210.99 TRINITY_DN1995_c0_g1_i4:252-2660(+)
MSDDDQSRDVQMSSAETGSPDTATPTPVAEPSTSATGEATDAAEPATESDSAPESPVASTAATGEKEPAPQEQTVTAPSEPSTRCKLYKLQDADWVAVGVGQATVMRSLPDGAGGSLLLIDEENPSAVLMNHTLEMGSPRTNYTKQQDTLILFSSAATQEEYGLSFEKSAGCTVIWDAIMLAVNGPPEVAEAMGMLSIALPPPTLDDLPSLAQALDSIVSEPSARNGVLKEKAAESILQENYLESLLRVFKEAEQAQDVAALHCMCRVMRDLLLINNSELMKELLSVEHLSDVIGCFEYCPERPGVRVEHRRFLEQAVFHNPLQLNQGLQERIKQHYMVQYLRETVAISMLDDAAFESLNNTMLLFRLNIVRAIARDEEHIKMLLKTLEDPAADPQVSETLLLLMQEMVATAKGFPQQHRNDLVEFVITTGLLRCCVAFITSTSTKSRAAVADILWQIAKYNVNYLRHWCLLSEQKAESCPLLTALFKVLLLETVEGIQHHWSDILTYVLRLHPQVPDNASDMPQGFIKLVYKSLPPDAPEGAPQQPPLVEMLGIPILYHPRIYQGKEEDVPEQWRFFLHDEKRANTVISSVLPIISCCVTGHTARMSTYLLTAGLPEKICALLKHTPGKPRCPSHVVIAVMGFLKALVGSSDEMMFRHIVQRRLLDPVFAMLSESSRYTLVNSSALSLVACIAKESCRTLIRHISENYASVLDKPQYAEVRQLVLNGASADVAGMASANQRNASGAKRGHDPTLPRGSSPFYSRLSDDNDAYFDKDTADEDMSDTSSMDSSESRPKRVRVE